MSLSTPIVIVGGGIIGLDVALVLAEQELGRSVTVLAEYLPGDTAVGYTSPWAGCNFSAISGSDDNALKWDRLCYSHLTKLASEQPKESFVVRTASTEIWDENVPHAKIQAMSEYLEDFVILPKKDLPEGARFGVSFTTVTINAPKHIEYLQNRLKERHGVQFVRQKIDSIRSVFAANPAVKIVFNCTGNAARTMPGVEDARCYPTRGQVVLVRAPQVRRNIMRHGKDYETYVIPRPESNGNVVLGGYMQKGNGDGATYSFENQSIMARTMALSSELRSAAPEILASFAGLRPSREGGARVEREEISIAGGEKRVVVHNYGAGGTGYQAGYGMALEVVKNVEDLLQVIRNVERRLVRL